MSEMKMNYIFIEKETQDLISMCEQIAELLGVEDSKMKSGNLPMSGFICLQMWKCFMRSPARVVRINISWN